MFLYIEEVYFAFCILQIVIAPNLAYWETLYIVISLKNINTVSLYLINIYSQLLLFAIFQAHRRLFSLVIMICISVNFIIRQDPVHVVVCNQRHAVFIQQIIHITWIGSVTKANHHPTIMKIWYSEMYFIVGLVTARVVCQYSMIYVSLYHISSTFSLLMSPARDDINSVEVISFTQSSGTKW